MPTDDWREPLKELLLVGACGQSHSIRNGNRRGCRSRDLIAFIANSEERVFEAHEARGIKNFFRWVTMSVTTRSRSANPNSVVVVEPTDLDEFDF